MAVFKAFLVFVQHYGLNCYVSFQQPGPVGVQQRQLFRQLGISAFVSINQQQTFVAALMHGSCEHHHEYVMYHTSVNKRQWNCVMNIQILLQRFKNVLSRTPEIIEGNDAWFEE